MPRFPHSTHFIQGFKRLASGSMTLLTGLSLVSLATVALEFEQKVKTSTAVMAQTLAPALPDSLNIQAVEAVGITVDQMDEALAFYTKVLPFKVVKEVEVYGEPYEDLQGEFGIRMQVVTLQLGSEFFILTDYLTSGGRPLPVDSRSNDLWFQHIAIVVRDMDEAYQLLRRQNVQHVSTAPQLLPDYITAAAGIEAFYFQDPDGHNLEIISFPPDKGDPRWQTATSDLFLGIDHTAIGISDTEASLAFYKTLLGLTVAGTSENYGPEQERLNNVFGAHLRITGLKAGAGPGVEFLDYLSPATGRPYPADARAVDLLHWETTLAVADADQAAQRLRQAQIPLISHEVVELPDDQLGFRKGFLVKDPDGHVLRIVEK